MKPKVSIIILNWNDYKNTIKCVESLEKISYDNYEIVIVDNSSKDNSEEYIKQKFLNYPLIQTGKNLGFAGGNNVGIKYALEKNTDYILLLNNDTVVKPNFLEALIESAEDNCNVGIVGGKIFYYDDPQRTWYAGGKINWLKGSGFAYGVGQIDHGQFDQKKEVTFVTGCMMLIKKEVIEKIGFLNEDYFLYLEDTEFCARVLKQGYSLVYTPNSEIYHKQNIATNRKALTIYYTTRNRLFLMKEYASSFHKLLFFIYFGLVFSIKLLYWYFSNKKEFHQASIQAFKDFSIGHRGKIG